MRGRAVWATTMKAQLNKQKYWKILVISTARCLARYEDIWSTIEARRPGGCMRAPSCEVACRAGETMEPVKRPSYQSATCSAREIMMQLPLITFVMDGFQKKAFVMDGSLGETGGASSSTLVLILPPLLTLQRQRGAQSANLPILHRWRGPITDVGREITGSL